MFTDALRTSAEQVTVHVRALSLCTHYPQKWCVGAELPTVAPPSLLILVRSECVHQRRNGGKMVDEGEELEVNH